MSVRFVHRFLAALAAMLPLLSVMPGSTAAQERPVPDTFTATTTGMTPAGVTLKIDVLRWLDDAARATVLSALTGKEKSSEALAALATVGYVWPDGSAVGYSLKYAHRAQTAEGRERITLLTDQLFGAYGMEPWKANAGAPSSPLDYTVIELYVDAEGKGDGTMSLAADVVLDQESHTVSLAAEDPSTHVLTGVTLEPKPYWAEGS